MINLKYLFVLAALAAAGCNDKGPTDPIPDTCCGKIVRVEKFPSVYITPRNVDIWLPEEYSNGTDYPVLYMHDGQMLFDSAITWNKQEWGVDEVLTGLTAEGAVKPAIVVGIYNAGDQRHGDYFPQKALGYLPEATSDSLVREMMNYDRKSGSASPLRADNYLRFIVEELKPHIDSTFSTLPDRENTFVAGSSMGGLISMYAICEYPAVFGGAACLSTHWPGMSPGENNPIPAAFFKYLDENLPPPGSNKFYYDFGTETLDQYYEPLQRVVDSIMVAHGYGEDNWKTMKFEGADHSEKSWNARLHIPFKFLMGITPAIDTAAELE